MSFQFFLLQQKSKNFFSYWQLHCKLIRPSVISATGCQQLISCVFKLTKFCRKKKFACFFYLQKNFPIPSIPITNNMLLSRLCNSLGCFRYKFKVVLWTVKRTTNPVLDGLVLKYCFRFQKFLFCLNILPFDLNITWKWCRESFNLFSPLIFIIFIFTCGVAGT